MEAWSMGTVSMRELPALAAIGAIAGITAVALVLGQSDGLVAAAITALATLGGVKLALKRS